MDSKILSFINELNEQGILQISKEPKRTTPDKEPPRRLDMLWLEITSRCNLRCVHCYAEASSMDEGSDLSKATIFDAIDDAAKLRCKKLQFTGGEPTIRSDFKELVEYAKSTDIEVIEVFTNGTLLTEDLIRFFSEENIHVAMSLYSYKENTHDSITQIDGSYERTLNSLKLLLAYDVPLECATIAMKQNEDELDATIYFLSKLGAITRAPDPIRPTGRGEDMKYWPENYGMFFIRSEPDFRVDEEEYFRNTHWNSCWFGKATITSTGEVLPCVFARDQIVGNIKKDRLIDLMTSEEMLRFWRLTKDEVETCRDCEYRYVCHDCRPWAYGYTGNLVSKSPRCTYNPYTGEWGSPIDLSILAE